VDSRAKSLCQIGARLFSKKQPYDSLCQDIAENYYPLRTDFTRTLELGDDFATGLMESYPVQARETLGNSINAMLRQGDWFAIKTGIEETDENPANARWLEAATKRFRRLVYDRRANFTAATIEADHDWVTFGNPVLSVGESPTRDHMLFNAWHPKDCAWMLNDVGKVDHLQRNMKMTARNLNRKYKGKVHADIVQAAEKDPSKEFNIRHVVLTSTATTRRCARSSPSRRSCRSISTSITRRPWPRAVFRSSPTLYRGGAPCRISLKASRRQRSTRYQTAG
jgi:hypothetical protein